MYKTESLEKTAEKCMRMEKGEMLPGYQSKTLI